MISTTRIAYCLLVHKNPSQVARLLRALWDPGHVYYVNVFRALDPKVQAVWERTLEPLRDPRLTVVFRYGAGWANFKCVAATLDAMRRFRDTDYDYFVNLTGQCYPIQSREEINRRLANSTETYMEAKDDTDDLKIMRRYTHKVFVLPISEHGAPFLYPRIRKELPDGMRPYGGSAYFCMRKEHVAFVLDYVEHHEALLKFYRRATDPDETFFQAVLMNSSLRDRRVDDNLRYIDWPEGASTPRILTMQDWPALRDSDRLWARKFDVNVDGRVLDELDRKCHLA
ncbi:MAG TPA: beta-1,6-N-acetylglucosaminyltransferase [Thermoplasmata archaeon]|nr:beta-1,6-N-acetylglucosaminyltransferase [Thermoplasmata archaeon]